MHKETCASKSHNPGELSELHIAKIHNPRQAYETWNIVYSNIRGLKGKIAGLSTVLNDLNPHIFLLTETQLRSDTGINIPGYVFFGRKREGRIGGGVGILVRNDLKNQVGHHSPTRNIELLWVSIRNQHTQNRQNKTGKKE